MLLVDPFSGFTSVAAPFSEDSFIHNIYQDLQDDQFELTPYLKKVRQSCLPKLLGLINASQTEDNPCLHILDIGVFMGAFTIALKLVADDLAISVHQAAYEANPALIQGITDNFKLYSVNCQLDNLAISDKAGSIDFGIAKDGIIGGTLTNPSVKAGPDGTIISVSAVSLRELLDPLPSRSLVKIDIEGHETVAFGSVLNTADALRHVFIIEFSPWQASVEMVSALTYGQFLLHNFAIYNMGDWLSPLNSNYRRLDTLSSLEGCLDNGTERKYNTDLLLIPNDIAMLW